MFHTHCWLTQWAVFCVLKPAQCRTLLTSNDMVLPQNSLTPSRNVPSGHSGQLSAPTHIGQRQKRRHWRQNTDVTAKNLPHFWGWMCPQPTKTYMNIISKFHALYVSQWHVPCWPRCGYVFVVVPTVIDVVLVVQLQGGGAVATVQG